MTNGTLYRKSAFTVDPNGGNPAGIWIGDELPSIDEMQQIAADVGYSETAFLAQKDGSTFLTRYYSPEKEVPFCGHATIATGVVLGERMGEGIYQLETIVGPIPVAVHQADGVWQASLTSVEPKSKAASDALLEEALGYLGWSQDLLDPAVPPMIAFAGAWHMVLAVKTLDTLNQLEYEFEGLKEMMLREDITTMQLIYRESELLFHSRNPFPVGGIVEDPATGAAAAALGGYLRSADLINPPATFKIRQGEAMGRPSQLTVAVPESGGISVSGPAVPL